MATTDVEFGEAPFEIIDGDRGKNYPKQKDFLNSGHCLFLSATNVTKSGFVFADCLFIDEKKDSSLNKGKLRREDIVLTTRGTLGNTAYFKHTVLFENIRINSGMVILRCDREKILPVYLYHFLRSPSFHEQVNSLRSGVAQPQLPIRDMRRIKLPLPTMPEQKRISGILSAYDELIENSQQRIKILESMARALYREWFVHFRFPGHEKVTFVSSPLGKIPEGWEVKKLKNVCRLTMGQSPKSEFYNEMGEGQPFHQGVTNFGNRFPTDRLFCTVEGRIAEAGDILFSVRAPVGRMNIAGKKIIIGRGLSAIRHNYGHQAFLWEQLRNRFSPLYHDENPEVILRLFDKFPDADVSKILRSIRDYQGKPIDSISDPVLREAIKSGCIPTPSVNSTGGKKHFAFTPVQGVGKLEKSLLEKARALVACVRYGQHYAGITRIKFPLLILEKLRTNKQLGAHSEILRQYSVLHKLGFGRITKNISFPSRYNFDVIDNEENMRALDLAIQYLTVNEVTKSDPKIDEAKQLLLPGIYGSPTNTRMTLRDVKTTDMSEQSISQLNHLIIGGSSGF